MDRDTERALAQMAEIDINIRAALPVIAEFGRRCNEALARDMERLGQRYAAIRAARARELLAEKDTNHAE